MLSISNLSCERDDRVLFHQLHYEFKLGKIVRLEGRNGAGKTTLLKILAGLFTSYNGCVSWHDEPVSDNQIDYHQNLLFIGHKSAVKVNLTPLENLRFYASLQASLTENDLLEALTQVGLYGYEHVLCKNLSAGQQRRVAIARLYFSDAKVWILDELFTAIDKQGVAQLEAFLEKKAKEGVCIILTTHHQLNIESVEVLDLAEFAYEEEAFD